MKISLIIATKNGGDKLLNCLSHVEKIETNNTIDCHLVDNGSTDGLSYDIIRDYQSKSRFDVSVYQTFIPGNSAARNVAIPHTKGDLILFLDDDCYPTSSFAEDWANIFQSEDIGYGCGMISPYDRNYSYESCNEYPHDRYIGGKQFVWRGFLTGSNMAFRKECLAQVGFFDERLGAGTPFAAEDWDMSLRASAKGWKGKYSPIPNVAHDHRRNDAEAADRWQFYDFGAGAVYAKHTFKPYGARIVREFIRELTKPDRRKALISGYLAFQRVRNVPSTQAR